MKCTIYITLLIGILTLSQSGVSQSRFLKTFSIQSSQHSSLPPSNSISQIQSADTSLWIGTSKGVSTSFTGGRSWLNFRNDPFFVNDGIFSLAVSKETIWTATGYEKEITDGTVQTGSGYTFSFDNGTTWKHLSQTLDAREDSIYKPPYGINDSLWILPVVVPEQNVTFDVSLSPGTVWIASWASGLRKLDLRRVDEIPTPWERILLPADQQNSISPFDTLWTYRSSDSLQLHRIYQRFDPRKNNNMLAFGVHAFDNDTIWCGTAGGINKSTDGGISWKKFSHQNQLSGIAGNWVIAIDHQLYHGKNRVWATNWKTTDPDEEYAVVYTDDGGISWTTLLHGVKAYDFAFKDSIVYIASDDGVYRTDNGGATFTRFSTITDPSNRQVISSPQVYALGILADTVFVGTGDGLASTIDNATHQFGSAWTIRRTYQPVAGSSSSYAYPNPFAPSLGPVRIHYYSGSGTGTVSVSIDIFDFGMNRVRTLIHDASRELDKELDELWDGRNDDGRVVANGVYFYRITTGSTETYSIGKILAIQ